MRNDAKGAAFASKAGNGAAYGQIYPAMVPCHGLLTEVEYRSVVTACSRSCSACWLLPMYGGISDVAYGTETTSESDRIRCHAIEIE